MKNKANNLQNIDLHYRAANYLTVAQLFLRDNFLLKRKLRQDDIKTTILGHWGACPGINFLYAHLCNYIRTTNSENYFILGSGHAAPALMANQYLEGSLGRVYPDLSHGMNGLNKFISSFGIDSRLQTEVSPALPGIINSGGELGVATACTVGSILNNPKKSCFCIFGDGEFETGATIPSLFGLGLLSPKKDGFLIFAVNLNQYKMGSRSLLSTWNKNRIKSFFESLNMHPFFCDLNHAQCAKVFSSISNMRNNWNKGNQTKIPIIILNSEKGVSGPLTIDGEKYAGSHSSHKVGKLKDYEQKAKQVNIIEKWLKQYEPDKLFNSNGYPVKGALSNFPKEKLKIGHRLEIDRKLINKNLLSNKKLIKYYKKYSQKIGTLASPMVSISNLIIALMKFNEKYTIFSPDEGSSNRIDTVINEVGIKGNSKWKSSVPVSSEGRVVEILNEICCHGMLQAYNQTGRDGLYITYEAFAPIAASLISQYYKILKISDLCGWKTRVPSLKYILSSLGWHNCYTHQNPDLLNTLLSKTDNYIDVYFPSDANHALACLLKMNEKQNSIQIMVAGKTNNTILRSGDQAYKDVQRGFWTKNYKSKKAKKTITIIAIGDYMVNEAISACEINNNNNLNIKIIIPVNSKMLSPHNVKKMIDIDNTKNTMVICTGYVNTFRGLFSSSFDIKNWIFAGYKDGFKLGKAKSVLKNNNVDKFSIIKYINSF